MSVSLAKSYLTPTTKSGHVAYDKINATEKWVLYSLDEIQLKKSLHTASFSEKCLILNALNVIEKKLKYHYNHKNFSMGIATSQLREIRRELCI